MLGDIVSREERRGVRGRGRLLLLAVDGGRVGHGCSDRDLTTTGPAGLHLGNVAGHGQDESVARAIDLDGDSDILEGERVFAISHGVATCNHAGLEVSSSIRGMDLNKKVINDEGEAGAVRVVIEAGYNEVFSVVPCEQVSIKALFG